MKKLSLDLMGHNYNFNEKQEGETNKKNLQQLKPILHQIIKERLTTRQKQILIMYFFEEKNIVEIAHILKVNRSTVSRTLKRAIENITKYLKYYRLR